MLTHSLLIHAWNSNQLQLIERFVLAYLLQSAAALAFKTCGLNVQGKLQIRFLVMSDKKLYNFEAKISGRRVEIQKCKVSNTLEKFSSCAHFITTTSQYACIWKWAFPISDLVKVITYTDDVRFAIPSSFHPSRSLSHELTCHTQTLILWWFWPEHSPSLWTPSHQRRSKSRATCHTSSTVSPNGTPCTIQSFPHVTIYIISISIVIIFFHHMITWALVERTPF